MNNEELVKMAACAGWPVCPGAAHQLAARPYAFSPGSGGIVIGSITKNLVMQAADEQKQSLVPTVRKHNGG